MAVKLRLKRLGRRHRPFFRLAAIETRHPRDGRVLEELGFYDPANKETAQQAKLNTERIRYWLGVGAVPSETVRHLLKRNGIPTK
jgi:small subunit ribosomal protein S16